MSGQTYDYPGRRHEAGHAVALLAGVQLTVGRQGRHPFGQERDQPVGRAIEQPDLDEIEAQQVFHVAGDVVLEQVGPLFDRHLGELLGRQVGELVARLVDRVDLELLLRLVGRLAGQGDQVRQRVRCVEDRRHREPEVAIAADLHRRAGRRFRGDRRRERAGIRPQNLRLTERLIELGADDLGRRIRQQMKLRVGPDDSQVRVNHGDAVRDRVEDLLGLDHHPDPAHRRELRRIDVHRVELLIAQQRKRLRDRADRHALERLGQAVEGRLPLRAVTIYDQQSRLFSHAGHPQLGRYSLGLLTSRQTQTPLPNPSTVQTDRNSLESARQDTASHHAIGKIAVIRSIR